MAPTDGGDRAPSLPRPLRPSRRVLQRSAASRPRRRHSAAPRTIGTWRTSRPARAHLLERVNEYTLRERDGDRRIEAIEVHDDDPTHPVVEPATVEERRGRTSREAQFAPMPPSRPGSARSATSPSARCVASRRTAPPRASLRGGRPRHHLRALTVLDFGDDNDSAHPLAVTVEPGSYSVDRVTAAGRNAAVRVRFSENAPVSWLPAASRERARDRVRRGAAPASWASSPTRR